MARPKNKAKSDEYFDEVFPLGYTPQTQTSNKFNLDKIGVDLKCKNPNQKTFINLISDNKITIAAGPAGTGKTYLACAQALKMLKSDSRFKKIILVKSVTVLEGEEIGFLKGDMKEKIDPEAVTKVFDAYIDDTSKLVSDLKMKMGGGTNLVKNQEIN